MDRKLPNIERKFFSPNPLCSDYYLPWSECAVRYDNDAVATVWAGEYAKTRVIHTLRQTHIGQEEQLRALLTDRGLLFPQTRERAYIEPKRSIRRHLTIGLICKENAITMADPDLSTLDRILLFGKRAYEKRSASFEEEYPLISLEKVQQGIRTLIGSHEGPFRLESSRKDYPLGICSGDIHREPARAEFFMEKWLDTNRFYWNESDYLSIEALKKVLQFSTVQLYEFLAFILPDCLQSEHLYCELLEEGADYCPSLNTAQEQIFLDQIERYQNEHLEVWKAALPALRQYLYPDFARFTSAYKDNFDKDISEYIFRKYIHKLSKAFTAYCNCMESLPADKEKMTTIAGWFLTVQSDHQPLFFDQPSVIFHLFRSPIHRNVYQRRNQFWSLRDIIADAYIGKSLPITMQSLKADGTLFKAIVKICAAGCKQNGIPFSEDEWTSLWECIEQTVNCLSYQKEDLFSVQYCYRRLLKFQESGYPVLDMWLEKRLTSEKEPTYISLWRTLAKKLCSRSYKNNEALNTAINTFRSLFEQADADDEAVLEHITSLCGKIRWNKIAAKPTDDELLDAAEAAGVRIAPRSRQGPAVVIRTSSQGELRELELVHMEWLLVQCVCDQARRELMEAVYLYLTETEEDPV